MPLLGTNMAEMKTYVHKSCTRRIRKEWGRWQSKAFLQTRRTGKISGVKYVCASLSGL